MSARAGCAALLLGLSALVSPGAAQAEGAGRLAAGQDAVGVQIVVDYAILTTELSWRHAVALGQRPQPLELRAALAMPAFVGPRDLRLRLGASHPLDLGRRFALVAELDPLVLRTLANEAQTMRGVGSAARATVGYLGPKAAIGAALSFDSAWTTHIRHEDAYREQVFAEAADGWYRSSATNLRAGLSATYRLGALDLAFDAGAARTGALNPSLLVPGVYATLGAAWRW